MRKKIAAAALIFLVAIDVMVVLYFISARSSSGNAATRTETAPIQQASLPNKLVFTYYFYWYESKDGHIVDAQNSIINHPPANPPVDYHNVDWHKKQFADMRDAGIDVALAVYWGTEQGWSIQGLGPMVQAADAMASAGEQPPKIGLFLDTTILAGRNLLTEDGKAFLYRAIKEFFDRVPRRVRAEVDGRPIIWLYVSDYASGFDNSTFDYLYSKLTPDLGARPFIVREVSWDFPVKPGAKGEKQVDRDHPIITDGSYFFNAALMGAQEWGTVAAVGPGYDDRRIPGRAGADREREDGRWYERNLIRALKSGRPWLVIETWDELYEGTGVCETSEFGRQYIELTRKYVDYLKAGVDPPPLSPGKYSKAKEVSVQLGTENKEDGLKLVRVGDGLNEPVQKGGRSARQTVANSQSGVRYLYFDVYEDFAYNQPLQVELSIDYFDEGNAAIVIEYDSWNAADPESVESRYKNAPLVQLQNTGAWRTATLHIADARFADRENLGTDFRLKIVGADVTIGRVKVTK